MSRYPEVLWAQRSDKVYLTVALPDARDVTVKCEPEGVFTFAALGAQEEPFEVRLELYGGIIPEENKGWWKQLLKSEGKPAPYIKVDWNKWCDEDEEESTLDTDANEYRENGNDDESSDDDGLLYLPDLERASGH